MDMGLFYDSTLCIIAAIVVTVATFETAKRKLQRSLVIMVEVMVENTNEKIERYVGSKLW